LKIAFSVSGRDADGTGHVMRCLSLANALGAEGHSSAIFFAAANPLLAQKCRAAGWDVFEGQGLPPKNDFDWHIVDDYHRAFDDFDAGASQRPKLAVIDDLINRSFGPAEMVINPNYGVEADAYEALVPAACDRLCGLNFCFIRPEFMVARRALTEPLYLSRNIKPIESLRIHVFFGGNDDADHTGQLARLILQSFKGLHVHALVSEQYKYLEVLNSLSADFPGRLSVAVNPNNVAQHMAACDVAIGGPGNATWERFVLGLPSLLFSTNDNQVEILKRLDDSELCTFAGSAQCLHTDAGRVQALIEGFLDDTPRFEAMATHTFTAVDGLGLSRLVEALSNTPPRAHVAPVRVSDALRLVPYDERHFEKTVAWLNLPDVQAGFGFRGQLDVASHSAWWRNNLNVFIYAIELDGVYVGNIVYHYDRSMAAAYFQIYLGDSITRGRGIGKAAMSASMDAIYEFLPVRQILLDVFEDNPAAMHIYKSLGFVCTGTNDITLRDGQKKTQLRFVHNFNERAVV
jgi:UDP-2,4-diacetamido-2,4,6-trideoxy-beta-L-altropyranose hydrolase